MRKGEGGAASGEDLLSGAPEGTRAQGTYRTPPLRRPANSPPGPGLRHLIPLLPFLSLLPSHLLLPPSFLPTLRRGRHAPRAYLKNQRGYRGP